MRIQIITAATAAGLVFVATCAAHAKDKFHLKQQRSKKARRRCRVCESESGPQSYNAIGAAEK